LGYSALDAAEEARRAIEMGRNPMLRTVVAMFYGALVQNHPGLTEDQAIDLFLTEGTGAQGAFKSVLQGVEPPKPVGNGPRAAKPKPKPKRGTGK
jgi:hypothetical protein